jgi:negative regulator of genetic competence, sporulation and motility
MEKKSITFEYEFVINHKDFKGVISCTKTVEIEDETGPCQYRYLYEKYRSIAVQDFVNKWIIKD